MAIASQLIQSVGRLAGLAALFLSIAVFPIAQASPNCQGTIQNKGYSDCAVTCVLGPLIGSYSGCAQGQFSCVVNQAGWKGAVTDCTPCVCPSLGGYMASLSSSITNAVLNGGSGGSGQSPITYTITTTSTQTVTQQLMSYSYTTASVISYITKTYTASPTTVSYATSSASTALMTITSCTAPSYTSNAADNGGNTSQDNSGALANPECTNTVSRTTAIAIGGGSGVAGIAIAALAAALFFRRRRPDRPRKRNNSSYVALTPSPGDFQRPADQYKLIPRVTQVPMQQQQPQPQQGYMQMPPYRQDFGATARAVSPNRSYNSGSTAWSAQAPSGMHEADNTANARGGYDRRLWSR